MAILTEEQFELDGYVFGGTFDRKRVFVLHSGLDFGSAGVRSQDGQVAGRDGSMFGRDAFDAPEWSFTLGVESDVDVWATVEELARVWRPASSRTPGGVSTLRYRRNGRTLRVYGRPRKFGLKPSTNKNDRFQIVEAAFTLAAPEQYLETTRQGANVVDLTLLPTDTSGGLVWPAIAPFEFRAGSSTRHGGTVVGGTGEAPFTATITGPVSGALSRPRIAGSGWEIASSVTVAPGSQLVIDTRTQTIQLDGVNVPGSLSRTSRLTARLTPGAQTLTFAGSDPSNTARCRFEWFDAVPL